MSPIVELPPGTELPPIEAEGSGTPSGAPPEEPEADWPPMDMQQRTDLPIPGVGPSSYFTQYTVYPYPSHAVVVINGALYWEWESVEVHAEVNGNPAIRARFTASEQEPWPADWAFLRIKPNDVCTILLDGFLAMTGLVVTRQVYYEAKQHKVEIQAWSRDSILLHSSADSNGNEYLKKGQKELVQQLTGAQGIGTQIIGQISSNTMKRYNTAPGQTSMEAIEPLLRSMGVNHFATKGGDLLLIGRGAFGAYSELVEGRDILVGRERISSYMTPQNMSAAQMSGGDDLWGAAAAQGQKFMGAGAGGGGTGDMSTQIFQRVISEIPATAQMLKGRGGMEDNIGEQFKILVDLTVLGWQRPGGGLWWPLDIIWVKAPMLIMNRPLQVKAVTFTQDNASGSRTTIQLVRQISQKAQIGGGGGGGGGGGEE
jgi:prophage tail gpP-like protein